MSRPTGPLGSALVVDDDQGVASLVAAFLGRIGLGVTVAHCRNDALAHLAARHWSLLVTDLHLGGAPGSEGLELLEQARRRWPGIRTILMSGAGGQGADATDNCDLFLPKPISFAQLSAAISSLLGTV